MDRDRNITANFALPSSGPSGWINFNGPEDAATPQISSSNYAPSAPGSFRISWSTPYASSSSTTSVTSDNSAVTPLSSTSKLGSKDFSGIPVGTYTFTNTNTAPSTASNTLEWGDTGGALFRVKRNGTVVASSGSSMSIGPSDTSKFGTYTLEVQNNAGEYEEVSSTTVDASTFSAESTKSASCTVVVGASTTPVVTISATPASGTAPVSATVHYTVANATEYTYSWAGPAAGFNGSNTVSSSSADAAPKHDLDVAGTYTFTITAKNASSGKSATASATVTVTPPSGQQKPTATITATPDVIYQGESFVLTLKTVSTKSWAFTAPSGGGTASMSGSDSVDMDNMTVTPTAKGSFTYKLSGVGNASTDGSTASDEVTVKVEAPIYTVTVECEVILPEHLAAGATVVWDAGGMIVYTSADWYADGSRSEAGADPSDGAPANYNYANGLASASIQCRATRGTTGHLVGLTYTAQCDGSIYKSTSGTIGVSSTGSASTTQSGWNMYPWYGMSFERWELVSGPGSATLPSGASGNLILTTPGDYVVRAVWSGWLWSTIPQN